MVFNILLHPNAQEELLSAVDYYKNLNPYILKYFIEDIFDIIDNINDFPEIYPIVIKNYRKAPLKKFPFYIVYEVVNESINILAIYHSKRNPEHIHNR